jgi:AcrR family transcriptional regulator
MSRDIMVMSKAKTVISSTSSLKSEAVVKPRVRERILRTANELFYQRGIRAVGVDSIACEAGTNKMSFYRNFASKDELVAEYLRDQEREGWVWWDSVMAANAGEARAQVEALFESHVKRMSGCDSRGCALANAAIEITDATPARAVVENHKLEVRRRFRKLARDMKAREPDALGDALMLLWEGSYLTRLVFPGRQGPIQNVVRAVRTLIDAHTR